MPSSNQDSYPFEELFIEFDGYNSKGDIFYKFGIDFQDQVFSVLSNSDEVKSFELKKSLTLPMLLSFSMNPLWNVEVQLELQKLKTGELFRFSCVAGPILSEQKNLKHFEEFANNLGLAFQIKDDLLDIEGDEKQMGKKTKKDLSRGKETLISYLPLSHVAA